MPYVVTKNAASIAENRYTTRSEATLGGDLKYRVASNLTIDATINPDFGQVESDPAVLNLSAYESFFDERRPFFVAGRGGAADVNFVGELQQRGILQPPYRPHAAAPAAPTATRSARRPPSSTPAAGEIPEAGYVRGAGRDDAARRISATRPTTPPPTTVARVKQDFRGGNSSIGGMWSPRESGVDQWSSPFLASSAYAAAMDFHHRFFEPLRADGGVRQSRVDGNQADILAPDPTPCTATSGPTLVCRSTRTARRSTATPEVHFGKVAGQNLMFGPRTCAQLRRVRGERSRYLRRADRQPSATGGFRPEAARSPTASSGTTTVAVLTTDGLRSRRRTTTRTSRSATTWACTSAARPGSSGRHDDRSARGGPAVRPDLPRPGCS